MSRVLIVSIVHRPRGEATAGALHWLLTRLQPDAIFLECSPDSLPSFLDGSCGWLESAAVMRFHHQTPVKLVPVDLQLDALKLKPKADAMFERIERSSARYAELEEANAQHTERGGFAYLNSPVSAELQRAIRDEIRATVEAVGEPDLTELFGHWTRTHDDREMAMIKGVEAFAASNSFEKGVLLVGLAHSQPLYEKTRQRPVASNPGVLWIFDWLDEIGPTDNATNGRANVR